MKQFDAIVIGAGQAGGPLAKKLTLAGKKTLLVEKRWIGGTCVNDGCTPTKTMIASAKMAYLAANSAPLGIHIKNYRVDMPAIKERKDGIVHLFRDGSQNGLEATKNLTVLFGEAAFTGMKEIAVKTGKGKKEEFKAELIFINTGAKTFIPEIDGLKDIGYLTSTTIMELDHIPKHLLILGGNYIGLEFGQMFRRFGSKVTVLEKSGRIVSREDEDISDALTKILEDEQISIHPDTIVSSFKKTKKGNIVATLDNNDTKKKIKCSHVLLAVGR